MSKVYTVKWCDSKECPFRITRANGISYCRLTNTDLTSQIHPLPKHCPLMENDVVVQSPER